MMVLLLLAAYGVTFGLQHKVPFLWDKHSFLDRLLRCTYCTGFHAGWIVYLLALLSSWGSYSTLLMVTWMDATLFAFASGAFAYLLDTCARCLETHSDPIEAEEEEEEEDSEE